MVVAEGVEAAVGAEEEEVVDDHDLPISTGIGSKMLKDMSYRYVVGWVDESVIPSYNKIALLRLQNTRRNVTMYDWP